MGKWDFACEDCDAAYYAQTKKEADEKAAAHTHATGHKSFHAASLPAHGRSHRDQCSKCGKVLDEPED